tara:strand:+ start:1105 stop:1626 length:522 start_codon:yes stop_codon:yes gene_type:complete
MTDYTCGPAELIHRLEVAKILKCSYNISSIDEAQQVFLDERAKGHRYIIALDGPAAIGIVSWTVHDLPKHQLAELNRIAVLQEYWGEGVSRGLFEALKRDTMEYYAGHGQWLRKLYVLTHEDNTRARSYYEKMGFKLDTILKQHYYADKNECVYAMFFNELGDVVSAPPVTND